ncbi:MAG: universal stress protein [Gammaproteobacteria bacterium]|nr:MAG: universal stress protein [Gammaproteobacteria bacterium]
MNYQHILFVTDLNDDSQVVAKKVQAMRSTCNSAKLSVLHVVLDTIIAGGYEIMPLFNYADDEENIQENAKALKAFIKKTGLHADTSEVVSALSTAGGIADYAKEHDVDLIVIGLHKRTGLLNSLLGNTATSVLNNAECDVFTVLIEPPQD